MERLSGWVLSLKVSFICIYSCEYIDFVYNMIMKSQLHLSLVSEDGGRKVFESQFPRLDLEFRFSKQYSSFLSHCSGEPHFG